MQTVKPIQVTFRHLPPSEEITQLVEREVEHLMAHRPPITSVKVTVERPHRWRHRGTPVRGCVELSVPGQTLVARARHEDQRVVIHEAFDVAERAVRSYCRRRRGGRQRVWLPGPRPARRPG